MSGMSQWWPLLSGLGAQHATSGAFADNLVSLGVSPLFSLTDGRRDAG
jgi:hypothetical protein